MTHAPTAPAGRRDLRQTLIDTALEMVRTEGVDAISMREVARRAGVSSGAPFRHFPDRGALLAAIAEEGLVRLEAAVGEAVPAAGDDVVRVLQAVGVAVAQFAATHPAHFRVMHLADVPRTPRSEAMLEANHGRMRALVEAGQARGVVTPGDPETIVLACISMIYGLARFYVDGTIGAYVDPRFHAPERAGELALAITEFFGRGLATPAYWRATEGGP